MIFIAAACLLAVSGVTAALAPAVSNAVGCCIRGGDNREDRHEAVHESTQSQSLVVQSSPKRRAITRTDNSSNSSITVTTDVRSLFALLQLHVGWQTVCTYPSNLLVRLHNCWAFVVSSPEDRTSLRVSMERILVWQSGAMPSARSSNERGRGSRSGSGGAGQLSAVVAREIALVVPPVNADSAGAQEGRTLPRCCDGVLPAIMIGTAETRARPPALNLESIAPALPTASGHKSTITAVDIRPCASPRSPGPHPLTSPCHERSRSREGSTSPRTRGGRPRSPRRVSVSPPRPTSPQRSLKYASTAGRRAASSSSSATAPQHHGSSAPGAARSEQEPILLKDTLAKQTPLDLENTGFSTTPPLTPASALSSPDTTTSSASGDNGSRVFFGDSYRCDRSDGGGYDKDGALKPSPQLLGDTDGRTASSVCKDAVIRLEEHGEVTEHNPQRERSFQAILESRISAIDEVDSAGTESEWGSAAAAVTTEVESGGDDGGHELQGLGICDPATGEFDAIVKSVTPGQLRGLFIGNLRRSEWGGLGEVCVQVRMASLSLAGSEESNSVKGLLEEVEVLGTGSFGVVAAVRHSIMGDKFALKKLKEGAGEVGRYCAKAEMLAMARLAAASPHSNILSAVCIDDRDEAIGTMPILFPRADMDFGQVVWNDGWDMPAKLRCLGQIASGVRHVHEQGIGHGDIKPENILLFDDGQGGCDPKLCDFGMSRALGELRPPMMGTPGYMPLEVMSGSVETHESQDTFAMAAVALVVCVAPEKAQPNMFASPDLYKEEEATEKKALDASDDTDPFVAARTQTFKEKLMKRTMADGSFVKLVVAGNLHPDLGCLGAKDMVSCCLPPFLDKNPDNRPGLVSFQNVMENLATDSGR